jgi:hypothetical protein
MSGRSSRDKGKRGELEACEYLAMTLGGRWTRTGSAQRRQDAKLADVTCDDWPDLHVEVKRGKRNLNLWAALEQAKRDSAGTGRTPVVLARRDREQWVLFAEADDLMRLQRRRRDAMMQRALMEVRMGRASEAAADPHGEEEDHEEDDRQPCGMCGMRYASPPHTVCSGCG